MVELAHLRVSACVHSRSASEIFEPEGVAGCAIRLKTRRNYGLG
jgi:hypothetical protein